MSLWVCSVIEVVKRWSEHQWHTWLCPVCHFFVFTILWCHLCSWNIFFLIEPHLRLQILLYVIQFYIISSVMYAFWLVLTYDLLEDRCIDDVIIKTFFNSLLYKTNRFQVVVRLFSNRSQRTSKCGKNIIGIYLLSI